ncbi:hypothetical protein LCGC14_1203500 [marine sediment metagenome]|uniref:Phage replisome organiser N-terminal domain-containing protein n=1 Tax=marine sediment metagenome TaxID=412755 RepID=A0A0F9LKJ6_9ZZZZ
MAKAPAFQFYPGDWRRDTQVQMASFHTRGVWIEILCCMWDAPIRGELSGLSESLARMLGCTHDEFNDAISEIEKLKIADVTISNGFVTIINRRMYKDATKLNDTRKRVKDHRERKLSSEKQDCNTDVTPLSSSSSSKKKQTKKKSAESKPYLGDLSSQITELAKQLARLSLAYPKTGHKDFNINGLIQEMVNKKIHEEAIFVALSSLAKRWTLTEKTDPLNYIKNPQGYAETIMKTKSGNYYEREHTAKSQEFKNLEMPGELLRGKEEEQDA